MQKTHQEVEEEWAMEKLAGVVCRVENGTWRPRETCGYASFFFK